MLTFFKDTIWKLHQPPAYFLICFFTATIRYSRFKRTRSCTVRKIHWKKKKKESRRRGWIFNETLWWQDITIGSLTEISSRQMKTGNGFQDSINNSRYWLIISKALFWMDLWTHWWWVLHSCHQKFYTRAYPDQSSEFYNSTKIFSGIHYHQIKWPQFERKIEKIAIAELSDWKCKCMWPRSLYASSPYLR